MEDIGVQTKQKRVRDRHTSPQHYPAVEKADEECQVVQEGREEGSQTSDNMYDYIEETYLEWMFDRDYAEMQKRKAQP